MALQSKLFTSDQRVKSRLERCQQNDRDHVMPGDRGDHVSAIQSALFILLPNLKLPDAELSDTKSGSGWYGPQTAAAVERYKRNHKPPILNYAQKIDPVVGKQTITFLDRELPAIPGGLPDNPNPNPTPVANPVVVDIAVRVQGYDNVSQAGQLQLDTDYTENARNEFGYPTTGRMLWFIFYNGGDGQNDPTDEIITKIEAARAKGKPGKVTLDGGSAGGKVVLNIAANLTSKKIGIDYLGVWDGAFQLSDRENPAFDVTSGDPVDIKTPVIQARERDNWFQCFGNTLVPEQEIHGKLKNFNNKQLDHLSGIAKLQILPTFVGAVRQKAADEAHTVAYKYGRNLAEQRVRQIMGRN